MFIDRSRINSDVLFAVDQIKFGRPLRKVTEPYPDLVMHYDCSATDDICGTLLA